MDLSHTKKKGGLVMTQWRKN